MDAQLLEHVFKQDYKTDSWKEVLAKIFPALNLYKAPIEEELTESKAEDARKIIRYGDVTLGDGKVIDFYEVELQDGKTVTRNRVGLRNLLHNYVITGLVDGIIATYYNKTTSDWRLSFISKNAYWDDEGGIVKEETHPKRYTFVLGRNESIKTAVTRIHPLLVSGSRGNQLYIDDILKAFSVQKISKEFFRDYKNNYKAFSEFLGTRSKFRAFFVPDREDLSEDEQKKETDRNISNFAKKLLGRIVFLYFLQKKGWLGVPENESWGNGERDFVSKLFNDTADKNNFYEKVLVTLFFDTLNKKRDADLFHLTGTKVPFLNGGLFDKVNDEPTAITFDPGLFENLFEFFNEYNFTIDENSPDDLDIGIDPEMLGLIFENLLEENRNKTGAFYTPKEVVHFMCKESLSLYLQKQLTAKADADELKTLDGFIKQTGPTTIEFIKKYADDIQVALDKVKVCDPAIGSGAFPLGILFEILRIRKEIFPHLKRQKNFDYREEKLNIMRKNIYGVDIDGGAVDIARLRFWLSLIVDEEVPSPLPNLDYKIMQGDSMMESFETDDLEDIDLSKIKIQAKNVKVYEPERDLFGNIKNAQLTINSIPFDTEELEKKVESFFKIEDSDEKRAKHKEIDDEVIKHIEISINNYEESLLHNKEIFVKKLNKDLLGATTAAMKERVNNGPTAKLVAMYDKKLNNIDRIRKKLIRITEQAERPYFLWHLFFKDIFDNGGFDIVIGNPPYGLEFSERLKNKYLLGSRDSYGIFMAHALKHLLKTNGVCSFIVSDTWLTIISHFQLREMILQNQLHKVISLPEDTFGAKVNACIYILTKFISDVKTQLIAADITNLSVQKRLPKFRDVLFNLEKYIRHITVDDAVYQYPQLLITNNSNLPIFISSPKIFALTNDTNCQLEFNDFYEHIQLKNRILEINQNRVEIIKFGDIAEVSQGISTGDNKYYLRKDIETSSYLRVNQALILDSIEIKLFSDHEKLNGVNPNNYSGRYFIPFDKGSESDTDNGWMPNYYTSTQFYIDWSEASLARMKNLTIAGRKIVDNEVNKIKPGDDKKKAAALRNSDKWFQSTINFSPTGQYSPTFRLGIGTVSQNTSSTILIKEVLVTKALGVLSSKLAKYLLKNYYNHTVHTQEGDIFNFPFLKNDIKGLDSLVTSVISKQRVDPRYDYQSNEQKEIDALVYEAYGLNKADINEVETWYARRYPKMAKYADIIPLDNEEKIREEISAESVYAQRVREIIALGENKRIEFKSTLRYCLKQKNPQLYIEHSVLKTIAAFLNSDGGTLLVGVNDSGNILGLDDDYSTFGKNKNHQDEWVKHFDNLTAHAFSNAVMNNIDLNFAVIDEKAVAIIDVKPSALHVFMKNKAENNRKQFYIRRNGSTIEIEAEEILTYVKQRWG